jgi:4-hydroxybenzoate polyprenyltransferase
MGEPVRAKLRTLLDLARISNLPTVWSNVLAGAVLAGTSADARPVVFAAIAASLLYSGGMFLNDAFDAEIDARERPERPIPSGRIARRAVLALGFGMLALALCVLGLSVLVMRARVALVPVGLAIAAGVVVYDRWHKGVAWSPVVMGACRAGLYFLGAFAAGGERASVLLPAVSLLGYVVGLTHVARFENASVVGRIWPALFVSAPALVVLATIRHVPPVELALTVAVLIVHAVWTVRALAIALRGGRGSIPRSVVSLIAGISLVDAAFIAANDGPTVALAAAVAAFAVTLLLQRWVRGT